MIVDRAEIDAILSRRVRRRVLMLPVRRGAFGELKRCQMRQGGVYALTPRIPYDEHRAQAERQPTRARAVLELVELCLTPGRRVTVTVLEEPERQGDVWLVRFVKGEHREMLDRDIYLCRHNDFTMAASQQIVRGDAPYVAPFAEDLKRAREKAAEKHDAPVRSDIASMRAAHRRMAIRKHTMTVEARRQLERVGKAIDRLEASVSVAGADRLLSADRALDLEAPESDGDTESDGTHSVVSPELAA